MGKITIRDVAREERIPVFLLDELFEFFYFWCCHNQSVMMFLNKFQPSLAL